MILFYNLSNDIGADFTVKCNSVFTLSFKAFSTNELTDNNGLPILDSAGKLINYEYNLYKESIMAIKECFIELNGQRYKAELKDDHYEVQVQAPAKSSWPEADHVYKLTVGATDMAGNTETVTSDDATYGNQLKLRVLETSKPTITVVSPQNASVYGKTTVDFNFELNDEGWSGINRRAIVFKVNGKQVEWNGCDEYTGPGTGLLVGTHQSGGGVEYFHTTVKSDADGHEKVILTYSAQDLSDGQCTYSLEIADYDGNKSDKVEGNFVVATAAPTLVVDTPTDNLITNDGTVKVSGHASMTDPNAKIEANVTINVNGNEVTAEIGPDGKFEKTVTIPDGEATVTITAKSNNGKETVVTRTVTVDKTKPVITDIVTTPLTTNVNGMITVTFKVVDA